MQATTSPGSITNVIINTPKDGDTVTFDASTGIWRNKADPRSGASTTWSTTGVAYASGQRTTITTGSLNSTYNNVIHNTNAGGVYTCPTAGFYDASAIYNNSGAVAGPFYGLEIWKIDAVGGNKFICTDVCQTSVVTPNNANRSIKLTTYCNAGDRIYFQVNNSTGGSITSNFTICSVVQLTTA